MKYHIHNMFKGGLLAIAATALVTACSDDHFDVVAQGQADQTLWENIKADKNLSQFQDLLSRITVMKSENDKAATLKYSDLLNSSQSFTVVAPLDGTFDYQAWSDTIDKANDLLAKPDNEREGRRLMNVASAQFAMNHIARFNFNLEEEQRVHLMNGKNVQSLPGSFNGVALNNGGRIIGSNGVLYTLQGINPFAYNIYDYLSADPEITAVNAYIKDPAVESETFSEGLSTPGAMNENGDMVYIDSVFVRTNLLLDQIGISLDDEDSCYVAVIPDNNAWTEALEKVKAIMNYAPTYSYGWDGSTFTYSTARGSALKVNADSLAEAKAKEAIITNMFFQPYRMGLESKKTQEILDHMLKADSLISSKNVIFYNPAAKEDAPDSNPNPMFQNAVTVDASNGYVLKLPNYSIDPAYSWVSKFSFQPIISYMTARSSGCTSSTGSTITLTNDNYNYYREKVDEEGNAIPGEMTGVEGDVLNNMYQRFEIANMAEAMEIDFRLNNVYSADYCIKLTLVPSNINYDIVNEDQQADFYENLCFSAEIIDDSDKSCGKVTYAYKKDGEKDDSNKKDAIIIDPMTGVTTLTLFPKFHFDKCYVDVPCPTGDTFPRLRITVPRGGGRNKIVYASLNIVEISCEPYRAE